MQRQAVSGDRRTHKYRLPFPRQYRTQHQASPAGAFVLLQRPREIDAKQRKSDVRRSGQMHCFRAKGSDTGSATHGTRQRRVKTPNKRHDPGKPQTDLLPLCANTYPRNTHEEDTHTPVWFTAGSPDPRRDSMKRTNKIIPIPQLQVNVCLQIEFQKHSRISHARVKLPIVHSASVFYK